MKKLIIFLFLVLCMSCSKKTTCIECSTSYYNLKDGSSVTADTLYCDDYAPKPGTFFIPNYVSGVSKVKVVECSGLVE